MLEVKFFQGTTASPLAKFEFFKRSNKMEKYKHQYLKKDVLRTTGYFSLFGQDNDGGCIEFIKMIDGFFS